MSIDERADGSDPTYYLLSRFHLCRASLQKLLVLVFIASAILNTGNHESPKTTRPLLQLVVPQLMAVACQHSSKYLFVLVFWYSLLALIDLHIDQERHVRARTLAGNQINLIVSRMCYLYGKKGGQNHLGMYRMWPCSPSRTDSLGVRGTQKVQPLVSVTSTSQDLTVY